MRLANRSFLELPSPLARMVVFGRSQSRQGSPCRTGARGLTRPAPSTCTRYTDASSRPIDCPKKQSGSGYWQIAVLRSSCQPQCNGIGEALGRHGESACVPRARLLGLCMHRFCNLDGSAPCWRKPVKVVFATRAMQHPPQRSSSAPLDAVDAVAALAARGCFRAL